MGISTECSHVGESPDDVGSAISETWPYPAKGADMTTTVLTNHQVLSDELMQTFAERAPTYDRENRFFSEDCADLRAAGYLEIAVRTGLGGRGLNLADVCQEQRRRA